MARGTCLAMEAGQEQDTSHWRVGIADVWRWQTLPAAATASATTVENVTFNVIQNPPNYLVTSITAPPGTPIVADNFGPFATGTGQITVPRATVRGVNPDINTAYAQFWSAAVTHEFLGTYVASIEYTGSHGAQLYSIRNGTTTSSRQMRTACHLRRRHTRRPAQQRQCVLESAVRAHQRARQCGLLELQRVGIPSRHASDRQHGLQFQANYTWSHSTTTSAPLLLGDIDDMSGSATSDS